MLCIVCFQRMGKKVVLSEGNNTNRTVLELEATLRTEFTVAQRDLGIENVLIKCAQCLLDLCGKNGCCLLYGSERLLMKLVDLAHSAKISLLKETALKEDHADALLVVPVAYIRDCRYDKQREKLNERMLKVACTCPLFFNLIGSVADSSTNKTFS